jgi:putative ABC transport system permease protein
MVWREWRAGDVRLLALAVVIAVASVAAVGFFTDRVRQALNTQANELLGADIVVSASQPLTAALFEAAAGRTLERSDVVEFPSMLRGTQGNELAAVKAVSGRYPLRGQMRISRELFGVDEIATTIPAPGEVWLEPRLAAALRITVGDSVELGYITLRVSAILTHEPARAAGNIFSMAPRLLLNNSDLAATGLITPASRVRHSVLLAGAAPDVAAFRQTVTTQLARGERLESIDDARPEVRSALEKADQFLGLAALVSVVLATVAVAMSAQRFASRHVQSVAILRCLGASRRSITGMYSVMLMLVGSLAAFVGAVIGFVAQFALVAAAGSLVGVALPAPSWVPGAVALMTGWVSLLGFSLPPILRLRDVPALRVLRRDVPFSVASAGRYVIGVTLLIGLFVWQAGSLKLAAIVIGGVILTLLGAALLGYGLLFALRRVVVGVGAAWRFGVNNLWRRRHASVVQVVAFGLGLMALLVLAIVRGDLLNEWMDRLPPQTPNRFLINIQPDQVSGVAGYLEQHRGHSNAAVLYPMVRGRLVMINDRRVDEGSFTQERAKHLIAREFNLSWSDTLPPDNTVTRGTWWEADVHEPAQWSVEEGMAKELGIVLGDQLTFRVADQDVLARVTSLRQVEWDNFRVNFFVIAPPALLESYPVTFITSFYLDDADGLVLNGLLRVFPNVTVIDVAAVMNQVRAIITRVTQAVEYVFGFTVLAGLMVMYAAIHATFDVRLHETAVLRTLGASSRQIKQGLAAEFVALGLVAGVLAALVASAMGYILADRIFHFTYTPSVGLWLTAVAGAAGGIGIAGVWGTRSVLRYPPLRALQRVV